MSWFSSWFEPEPQTRIRVRVQKANTTACATRSSNSAPASVLRTANVLEQTISIPTSFSDVNEELQYYKQLCVQQAAQIEELKTLPRLQQQLHDEHLNHERMLREQSEENAKILIEQRNVAQVMYTQSESTLLSLRQQLSTKQQLLESELRKLSQESGNSKDKTLLDTLEKTIKKLDENVTKSLHDWENSRGDLLLKLNGLCEYIDNCNAFTNEQNDSLVQLVKKLNEFIDGYSPSNNEVIKNSTSDNHVNHINHIGHSSSPLQDIIMPHRTISEPVMNISNGIKNGSNDNFTSLLLYGSSPPPSSPPL